MKKSIQGAALAALLLSGAVAWAKLPPPPPLDEKGKAAAEEKKAKDEAAKAKAKADMEAAEERTLKNYHANMKQAGKPIPKAIPVATVAPGAAPAAPAAPAKPGAAPAQAKKS